MRTGQQASRRRTAERLGVLALLIFAALVSSTAAQESHSVRRAYLGFDENDYPGDAALPELRKTFSFAGYWLNVPPGTSAKDAASLKPWLGHRAALAKLGFGFLVLFNGRWDRELKTVANASILGASDARAAVTTAKREGFAPGTVIFVDQEEGGSMDAAQMEYLTVWFDVVTAAGFRGGIYCSAMPANEGHGEFTITANYIRAHAGHRNILYFVYNDACPPAPGCAYARVPEPSESGVPFAVAWQFAQSPRRRQFTRACAATYNHDGRCYPPGMGPGSPYVDLESATSPDPSGARASAEK